MTTLERYQALKRAEEVENAKAARAEGAKQQLLSRLKSEHGCPSVEEGEKLLKSLTQKRDRLGPQFEKMLVGLEEEYGDRLGEP